MKPTHILALIIVLLIPLGLLIAYRGSDTTPAATSTTTPSSSIPNLSSTPTMATSPSTYADPADAKSATQVVLKTSKGDIALNLFPSDAPLAVKNFVTLGSRNYYNGVIFHRVIKGFMNQAGDPTGTGSGGESIYGTKFKTEITKYQFFKGVLGVARTAQMDTNGSQFFIMAADTHSLDNQYTAFGQVADATSQAVVDAINAVPTTSSDKPLEDIKITGFQIVK